eukprot:Em0020g811a
MSVEGRKQATYPVWIGNLKETVTEKDLKRIFNRFTREGGIASAKVMRDHNGQSKKSGYVNFYSEAEAETAAKAMERSKIASVPIKTKGPSVLRKEGHLDQSMDHRPITDCLFYMKTGNCKKGELCPYRHSEIARSSIVVCPRWSEKNCSNRNCPDRHPGGMDEPKGADTAPAEVGASGGPTFYSCNGQCGDPICEALFKTEGGLRQHISQRRGPQAGVLQDDSKDGEESDHSDSTGELSEPSGRASDVEILTDSEREGDTKTRWPAITPPPGHTKEGSGPGSSSSSSEDSTGAGNDGGYTVGRYGNGVGTNGINGANGGGRGGAYVNGAYEDGGDSGSDEGDDAGVNEQEGEEEDMLEQNEGEEERIEYSRLESLTEEESSFSDQRLDQEIATTGAPDGSSMPSSVHPPHSPRHVGQLEPVGVFWDIENCQVTPDKSAFALANKIRKMFFEGKREAEFLCVCDINKERKEVMDDLNKAQVTVVHVSAVAKNAADDKLRQSLRRFAHTYHPPCTVVLISGDVNFAAELKDLRHAHNITITLVHNRQASDALKVFANKSVLFEDLLQDLEPPSLQPQSSSCEVIVSGLPVIGDGPKMVERRKIQARLSVLCDNCGGKVREVNVKKRTAVIVFRSVEAAMKAQKRMTGEDVYGSKILVKVQRSAHTARKKGFTPAPPQPLAAGLQGAALPYGAQGGPLPPFGAQPGHIPVPPRRPGNPSPNPFRFPAKHRPSHGDVYDGPPSPLPMPTRSFTEPQPMPPIPRPVPAIVSMLSAKLLIKVQADVEVRRNPNVLRKPIHDVFVKAHVQAKHLAFLWYNCTELDVLLQLDILQSAIEQKDSVADLCNRGFLTPDMARSFAAVCCKAIHEICQFKKIPWEVEVCSWADEKEMDRYTRSHVIQLLMRQPDGYMKWTDFKMKYSSLFGCSISELTIQTTCKDAIHLLGNASQNNQVIVLYELSPLIRLPSDAKTLQTVRSNLVGLLVSRPERQIRLMKIVSAYERKYGPLPVSKQGGQPLQNVIGTTPNFIVKGKTPSSLIVTLKERLPPKHGGLQQSSLKSKPGCIEELDADFQTLMKEAGTGDAIPYKNFQQAYQTHFHRSFRVSDFVGQTDATMLDLLKQCKGVKVQDDCVILVPPPAEPPPDERVAETSEVNVEKFKKDCIAVFGSSALSVMTLVQFKEEYERFFKHQLKLADYGGKKLVQLFEAISDTVKMTGDKDLKCVQLLDSKESCEKNMEELLCAHPDHKIPLDILVSEYTKRFGPIDSTYYGHRKLLSLLEAMPNTVKCLKNETKWYACLTPVRLFACEIKELLGDYPDGMGINSVNPNYKTKFQRDFSVDNYGFSKLIVALEAIQDVIIIEGAGPSRKIKLKAVESKAVAVPAQTQVTTTALQTQEVPAPQLPSQAEPRLDAAECRRLCTESGHILFCHQEHAMTVAELWDTFRTEEDPASPSIDELYQCLKDESTKKHTFEIIISPSSIYSSVVQLNVKECRKKLQQDLLHVFVCYPTADFSLPLSAVLETYKSCFGHTLNPAVYRAQDLPGLMGIPCVAEVIKLDHTHSVCSLTEAGVHIVVTSLLTELIFTGGSIVKSSRLLELFRKRFEITVNATGLSTICEVLREPTFQIIDDDLVDLTPSAKFVEQVRHLLTIHSGRLLYCEFDNLFGKEFGVTVDQSSKKSVHSKIFPTCSHIARLTRRKWLVWRSPSCSYPPRNGASKVVVGTIDPIKKAGVVASHLDINTTVNGPPIDVTSVGDICSSTAKPVCCVAAVNSEIRSAMATGDEGVESVGNSIPEPYRVTGDKVVESVDNSIPEPCRVLGSDVTIEGLDGMSRNGAHIGTNAQTSEALSDGLLGGDNTISSVVGAEETKAASSFGAVVGGSTAVQELDFSIMTKEQVIEVFDREKTNPALMPRFLEYFGDLSGRELERIGSTSNEKPVLKSTPRRKTNMAIRFPGIPPATLPVDKTVGSSSEEQKEPSVVKSESAVIQPVLPEVGTSGYKEAAVVKSAGVTDKSTVIHPVLPEVDLCKDAAILNAADNGQQLKSSVALPSPTTQEWPAL